MAKFCTWCGAPLEPGARFCGECGGRILETVMVDGSKKGVDELSGFDIVDGRKLPADATLRLDRDSVVVPTDTAPKRFSLDSVKKRRRPLLIVAGIAAVALVAGVLFASAYLNGWILQETPPASQAEEPPAPASPSSYDRGAGAATSEKSDAAATPIKDKEDAKPTEGEVFYTIDAAYDKLSVYEERIGGDGGLVEDFNASFLASSMDVRTRAKETADKVLADLQKDLDALNAVEIPSGSAYAEQREAVAKLYGYQIGRVSGLTEAWALDVTFERPSEHKDEILAVYTEKSSDGSRKYLSMYDELYEAAKPTERS